MKKLFSLLLVVTAFVCALNITAFANDGTVPRYVNTTTPLFENPNESSRSLETIEAGTKIYAWVDVKENDFTNVMTNTNTGWIPTVYISTTPVTPTSISDRGNAGGGALISLDGTWNCTKNLCQRANVYANPTTAANPIATLEAGTPVYVESVVNGFAHITSPSNGYIVSTYVAGWNVPTNYPKCSNTWYAGHDWEAVYNYEYYKANNPDVVQALGTNETALIQHFVECGTKEGRKGNGSFDLLSHIINNRQLYDRYGLNDLSIFYKHACGIPF